MSWMGNYGRFSERIKKIFRGYRRKKNNNINIDETNKAGLKVVSADVFKIIASIPLAILADDKEKKGNRNNDIDTIKKKKNVIKSIDVSNQIQDVNLNVSLREQKDLFRNSNGTDSLNNVNNQKANIERKSVVEKSGTEEIRRLEKRIIDLIKKKLIENVSELEVLKSELFIISEVENNDIVLNECQENINRVKELLNKIDEMKRQYDYLKDNFDFEYILELKENNLVDDIILLKNKVESSEIKALVSDYKLLDTYKFLYLEIDDMNDKLNSYYEYKDKKALELKDRDIDFEKLKEQSYNLDRENSSYEYFVSKQEKYINELQEKIGKIDSREKTTYHYEGFDRLFFNSVKYLGLMALSPLSGLFPGITTEAIVTKNVISNLRDNLKIDEVNEMVYSAIDYSNEINNVLYNLNSAERMADSSLEDVAILKKEYMNKFSMYQGNFKEYDEVIKQIENIENLVICNRIKVGLMKERALVQERKNKQTLKRVIELNKNSTPVRKDVA